MRKIHSLTILVLFCILYLCSSCATIISGTRQKVELYSTPDSAHVFLNGKDMNMVTPGTVKVNRRQKPTLYNGKNEQVFVFKKEGYKDYEVKVKAKNLNPMLASNIGIFAPAYLADPLNLSEGLYEPGELAMGAVPFVLGGVVIDFATGANKTYDRRVFAFLEPDLLAIQPQIFDNQESVTTSGGGLALCIGNGNYKHAGTLANPENDANDMAAVLKELGYEVMLYNNLNQDEMRKAIDQFGNNLKNFEVGLFFYAGHGIQAKGNNYLIPVDANIGGESEVEYTCVNAGRILGKMENAGSTTNIVIMDACRNNPFERSWSRSAQGRGLAVMDAPIGSLIGFATSPGNTASDGSGRNGLYTSALLSNIREPGITVIELFQKVRRTVREASGGTQVPWESTSLEGNYYFKKQ